MALSFQRPLEDAIVQVFTPVLGTPAGTRTNVVSPVRGWMVEAGCMVNSLVTSALTLSVAIGNQASSAASAFTQVVTSTLGTFSSTNTMEGAVCSVIPPSPAFVNCGDPIQFTTSGGQTSAVGGTVYAVIRRA